MAKAKNIHSCVVKNCTNTKANQPNMEFLTVPKELSKRKLWLKTAGQRLNKYGIKSVIYICEEHFDLEKDMDNYRLKPDVIPHKCLDLPDLRKTNNKQEKIMITNHVTQKIIVNMKDECLAKKQMKPGEIQHKCNRQESNKINDSKQNKIITDDVSTKSIVNMKDECIKNNVETLNSNPIRINKEYSKYTPKEIIHTKNAKIKNNVDTDSKQENSKDKIPVSQTNKNTVPQKYQNEIEFVAVPVNRANFCKETISVKPIKPVKLQRCEYCRKEFRKLDAHIRSSVVCTNYWRRLENKKPIVPINIAPKPIAIRYKVNFVPEARKITITFDKMNTTAHIKK